MQLMKELSVNHHVIYIDYAYTIKDVLVNPGKRNIPVKNILSKGAACRVVELPNSGKVHVVSLPPMLPLNWISNSFLFDFANKFNSVLALKRIKSALKRLKLQPDIVINAFSPIFGDASFKVNEKAPVLYYCYDNIDATVWAKKHGQRLEKKLLKEVKASIFSSDALSELKSYTCPAYVVNNGVDVANFNAVFEPGIKQDEKKVVGYTGCVDDRLDYELLEEVIKANPEIEFQFIGKIASEDALQLKKFSNVFFHGSKSPEELPALMSKFSIGIIPFVKNKFTMNIYPMKVNEYLALGLPVVMTDFAELKDLSKMVTVSEDGNCFSELIKQELSNDSAAKRIERADFANKNSWTNKAKEFETLIANYVN
jgi:glycosyltransferase involved in cell wall biosynthesis